MLVVERYADGVWSLVEDDLWDGVEDAADVPDAYAQNPLLDGSPNPGPGDPREVSLQAALDETSNHIRLVLDRIQRGLYSFPEGSPEREAAYALPTILPFALRTMRALSTEMWIVHLTAPNSHEGAE